MYIYMYLYYLFCLFTACCSTSLFHANLFVPYHAFYYCCLHCLVGTIVKKKNQS